MEAGQALGPGDRSSLRGCPHLWGRQGAASRPGASVSTFVKVFQNLPPIPAPFSPFDVDVGHARGPTGGAGAEDWEQTARRSRVPQSHAPRLAPAFRAAIVPAQPPPVARPTRAPASTPGRGARLRRWRHNNINTVGPPADPAPRRLPHSPGSAANDHRKAHRQTPAPSGRSPQPLASVARVSAPGPRRPASAAPLSNRDASRHCARLLTSLRRKPPLRNASSPPGGAAPGPGLWGRGPAVWGRSYSGGREALRRSPGGGAPGEPRRASKRGVAGSRRRRGPASGTWQRVARRNWPEAVWPQGL